jgi:hypothetical protein
VLELAARALARLRAAILFVLVPQEPRDDEHDAWW